MKVTFSVRGRNEAALYEEAKDVLFGFSESRRWNIKISAEPDFLNNAGEILSWRGEVTATHEDLET